MIPTPCSSRGGRLKAKHFDENHFTIYKKGFLALDSGARGGSSKVGKNHQINYYYDTIAHNCAPLRMEGERSPVSRAFGRWSTPAV